MKCKTCGLVNFKEATTCGRCGQALGHSAYKNSHIETSSGPAKGGSVLYKLAFLGAIAALGFYLFGGSNSSSNANNIAGQPSPQPEARLTRTEYQQQQTRTYTNALQENPDLKASEARTAEIEKLMPPAPNK